MVSRPPKKPIKPPSSMPVVVWSMGVLFPDCDFVRVIIKQSLETLHGVYPGRSRRVQADTILLCFRSQGLPIRPDLQDVERACYNPGCQFIAKEQDHAQTYCQQFPHTGRPVRREGQEYHLTL